VQISPLVRAFSLALPLAFGTAAMAEAPGDPKAVKQDDKGKYLDAKGDPTFNIKPDGTVTAATAIATSVTVPAAKARVMRRL
jgi:hypothetical protein